jgi:hypothetical protein
LNFGIPERGQNPKNERWQFCAQAATMVMFLERNFVLFCAERALKSVQGKRLCGIFQAAVLR